MTSDRVMLNTATPKVAQKEILRAILNGAVYVYAVIHRQYGKSYLATKVAESQLLKKKYSEPFVAICTPTIVQAQAIYENKLRAAFEPFSPGMRGKSLMFKRPKDNAICAIEFFGADNFSDSDRGRTSVLNICDESASLPKGFWLRNIFPFSNVHNAPNLLLGTTSRGANHFKKDFDTAVRKMNSGDKDYFAIKWSVEDSLRVGDITQEQYDRWKKIYENDDATWRGEYMMDWYAYMDQQIYGREISNAFEMGRVGSFPYDMSLPVDTFWDIGRNGTAVWFRQDVGGTHRYIQFYDDTHKVHMQTFFTNHILKNMHKYNFRTHYFPHDMANGESLSTETRIEVARRMLPGNCVVVNKTRHTKAEDLIDKARRSFERCRFDEIGCAEGLDRLQKYSRAKSGKPDKNEDSHGADAFTLAENLDDFISVDKDNPNAYIERDIRLKKYEPRKGGRKTWWL